MADAKAALNRSLPRRRVYWTRRRAACELVKGLSTHYSAELNGMFSAYVQGMMERYAVNPLQNWKEKDCVLHLDTTLAPKQPLRAAIGFAFRV